MMCGFRQIPIINNCIIVPAVPIQAGMPASCGGAALPQAEIPVCGPPPMASGCGAGFAPNAAGGVVPSGTMPGGGGLSGFTCNANFETVQRVMEQPLQCAPTIIHHHNRVQHLVPCIKTNIHHVHSHHEWIPFEQREINEVVNHTHGVRPTDQQLCNSIR